MLSWGLYSQGDYERTSLHRYSGLVVISGKLGRLSLRYHGAVNLSGCCVSEFIFLSALFTGHHTIYIGVHVPKSYRRRRRHRRKTGHKDRKEKLMENVFDKSETENNDEGSNSILKPLSKFRWTRCQAWLEFTSVFAEGCSLFQRKTLLWLCVTWAKLLSPLSGQK